MWLMKDYDTLWLSFEKLEPKDRWKILSPSCFHIPEKSNKSLYEQYKDLNQGDEPIEVELVPKN